MISLFLFINLLFSENLKKYNFLIHCDFEIMSCTNSEAILPNGDKIQIPIINNKVPVIYIQNKSNELIDLKFDFNDKNCIQHKALTTYSFQNFKQASNSEPSFLETFSSIEKEIKNIQTLNNNGVTLIDGKIDSLYSKIKDLQTMAVNIENAQKDFSKKIDTKTNFNELKSMISEVQKELVDIKKKLDVKTEKVDKKNDIIEPNLPIYDKIVVPKTK